MSSFASGTFPTHKLEKIIVAPVGYIAKSVFAAQIHIVNLSTFQEKEPNHISIVFAQSILLKKKRCETLVSQTISRKVGAITKLCHTLSIRFVVQSFQSAIWFVFQGLYTRKIAFALISQVKVFQPAMVSSPVKCTNLASLSVFVYASVIPKPAMVVGFAAILDQVGVVSLLKSQEPACEGSEAMST
jgi:hypothetical protein